MGSQIVRPEVSFDLNDSADSLKLIRLMDQIFAQQFTSDQNCISVVKAPVKFPHGCEDSSFSAFKKFGSAHEWAKAAQQMRIFYLQIYAPQPSLSASFN